MYNYVYIGVYIYIYIYVIHMYIYIYIYIYFWWWSGARAPGSNVGDSRGYCVDIPRHNKILLSIWTEARFPPS